MSSRILAGCKDRQIRMVGVVVTLAIALCLVSSPSALSQELAGTVTRDPGSGLVTYTYEFKTSPEIVLPTSKIALPVVPDKIVPGTIVSPVGWDVELVVPPGSTFWNYDPLMDPKFLAGDYGPNLNAWIDPPLLLWSANSDASAVIPGNVLAGFQFVSPFLPVNVPAQFQLIDGQVFSIDPPSPGDQLTIPEPATFVLMLVGLATSFLRRPA